MITDQKLSFVLAESAGAVRTETFMGREFVVVPAVLVQSQVLNNNLGRTYLPEHEVTDAWADLWNMVPVIIDHPTHRGHPVSAKDPAVLNSRGVGFVFRAHAENGQLKADVYLDPSRVEDVPELAAILEALEEGNPVELSTGFPTLAQQAKGEAKGKKYDYVMQPKGADHLAVFTDKTGACSVADGCGLGVNCSAECGCTKQAPTVEVALMDEETMGRWERTLDRLSTFIREIGIGGSVAENESDEDRRRMLAESLRSTFGGPGRNIWVAAVFSEDGQVVFELDSQAEGPQLLRAGYEVAEDQSVSFSDPEPVRRITEFVPVANEQEEAGDSPNPDPNEGEDPSMNRKEVIAQLSSVCPLSAERLAELGDEELQALHEDYASRESEPAAEPAKEKTPEPAAQPAANAETGEKNQDGASEIAEALNTLTQEVRQLREARAEDQEALNELREITRPAVEERERERSELVSALSSNERVPYSEDELKPKSVEELRKLQALARGENYTGRGGPKVSATNRDEPQFMPPVPYWQDQTGKEAN